jgi:hypothetical protein
VICIISMYSTFYSFKGDTKVTTDVEVSFFLCGGCVPSTMKVQAIATFTTISGMHGLG